MAFWGFSCQKDPFTQSPEPGPNDNPINWQNPEVGQVSHYLGFIGENYFDDNDPDSWAYHADTLTVEIIDKVGEKFHIREVLLPGSLSRHLIEPLVPEPDSTFFYWIEPAADSLFIRPAAGDLYLRTHLFRGWGIDALPRQTDEDLSLTFEGWKTDLPYCECYREGNTAALELMGNVYSDLNVIIDNRPMQVDGPGFTLVYNDEKGVVRAYRVSWWFQRGLGWDLLP